MFQFLCVVTILMIKTVNCAIGVLVSLCCYPSSIIMVLTRELFQFLCVVTTVLQMPMCQPSQFQFLCVVTYFLFVKKPQQQRFQFLCVVTWYYEPGTDYHQLFQFLCVVTSSNASRRPSLCVLVSLCCYVFLLLLEIIRISFSFFVLLPGMDNLQKREEEKFQFLCVVTLSISITTRLTSVLVSLCCYL